MAQRQSKNRDYYFRQVDFIFYREKEIKEAVFEKRNQSRAKSVPMISLFSSGSSDPTAAQALRNLTPLTVVTIKGNIIVKNPEKWLEVIDKTYNWCKRQKDCRYEVARRRYNGEDYRKTCIDLHISETTNRRLLETVRVYAALQAVQAGLLKIA